MKNTLLTILFIVALGQFCHYGLPWWALAPIAGIAGWLFPQSALRCFLAGFAGGFLLWLMAALWLDMANDSILSGKIGQLFMGISSGKVLLLTAFLGGLIAALACLTGRWAGDLFGYPAHSSKKRHV